MPSVGHIPKGVSNSTPITVTLGSVRRAAAVEHKATMYFEALDTLRRNPQDTRAAEQFWRIEAELRQILANESTVYV